MSSVATSNSATPATANAGTRALEAAGTGGKISVTSETVSTATKTPERHRLKHLQPGGGRNLLLMGALAILIALFSTSISLIIYHNSGDIYLDRSRPGFLPDEEESSGDDENPAEDYEFQKSGSISETILDDYLENLHLELKALDAYSDPFNETALSDELLGL